MLGKQNDCQALTEEMRLGLYALHMEEKKTVNTVDPTLRPFAWVDQIDDNSPAQKAVCIFLVYKLLVNINICGSSSFSVFSDLPYLCALYF